MAYDNPGDRLGYRVKFSLGDEKRGGGGMRFIKDLAEGDNASGVFFCKQKTAHTTKAGKPFLVLTLQDKTGSIDAKIWDPDSPGINEFDEKNFIHASGEITSFQGKLQFNIRRLRLAEENEYNIADYVPVTEKDPEAMFGEIKAYIESVENPYLSKLLGEFFDDAQFAKRFKSASAAKSVHHGFAGGLLEHTLNVTKICDRFCELYPNLNRDLTITAAIFHDIGKLDEITPFPENDYSDEGQLLGHIVIGAQKLSEKIEKIEGFPARLRAELLHCILSHHGELEFGSPKKPALAEAVALSFADNSDAKLETIKEALAGVEPGSMQWQGYNRFLESNIRRTSV